MSIKYNLRPCEALEFLYAGNHQGYTEDMILELEEDQQEITLPGVIREFYSKYAELPLCKSYNYFEDVRYIRFLYEHLEEEKGEWFEKTGKGYPELTAQVENYLMFGLGDDEAWTAGILEEDVENNNPPIYISSGNLLEWEKVYNNADEFLAHKIVWENSKNCQDFKSMEVGNPETIKSVISHLGLDENQLVSTYSKTFACCWQEEEQKLYMFLRNPETQEFDHLLVLNQIQQEQDEQPVVLRDIKYNLRPCEVMEYIYYGKHDGYPENEVQAVEESLGITLPPVLREFYTKYAKLEYTNHCHYLEDLDCLDFLYNMMENEKEEWEENYEEPLEELKKRTLNCLLFGIENQGVWNAGIVKEDLSEENPPVYLSMDDWFDFRKVFNNIDSFFASMILWENARGCKDFEYNSIQGEEQVRNVIREQGLDESKLVPGYNKYLTFCWDPEQATLYMFFLDPERDAYSLQTLFVRPEDRRLTVSKRAELQACVEELEGVLKKTSGRVLPLSYRLRFYRQLNKVSLVHKIFLECAKYVYPCFQAAYPQETEVPAILHTIEKYLYGTNNDIEELNLLSKIRKFRDKYYNHVFHVPGAAGMALHTVSSLAYSIICEGAKLLEKEYENDEDQETIHWLPDYTAYVAQKEENKEYWLWYIQLIGSFLKESPQPLLPLPVIPEPPVVTQEVEDFKSAQEITPKIKGFLTKIRSAVYQLWECHYKGAKSTLDWDSCSARVSTHVGLICELTVTINGETSTLLAGEEIAQLFYEMKKCMYDQYPEQGAWFHCFYDIKNGHQSTIPRFNYTQKELFTGLEAGVDNLRAEFEKFPRLKKYTPLWLQDILGEDAPYLDIPERVQTVLPHIERKIERVRSAIITTLGKKGYMLGDKEWSTFTIHTVMMGKGVSAAKFKLDIEYADTTRAASQLSARSECGVLLVPLYEDIKEQMYKQSPSEGGWIRSSFTFFKDENTPPLLDFNYDHFDQMENREGWQNRLHEFELYPRCKEYTPKWWQNELTERYFYLPPPRTQSYRTENVQHQLDQLREKMLNIRETLRKQIPDKQFERCTITSKQIAGGCDCYIQLEQTDGTKIPVPLMDPSILVTLNTIKSEMYQQVPEEGAWLECIYILEYNSGEYNCMFNYDNNSLQPVDLLPERIGAEMMFFPRSELYTPQWLKTIMNR